MVGNKLVGIKETVVSNLHKLKNKALKICY